VCVCVREKDCRIGGDSMDDRDGFDVIRDEVAQIVDQFLRIEDGMVLQKWTLKMKQRIQRVNKMYEKAVIPK